MRLKRVILGLVLLVNLLYGEKSNLDYFKAYIDFKKNIFKKPSHEMNYNVGIKIKSHEIVNEVCQITYDIFPYFKPLWAKAPYFPSFNSDSKRFDLKQGKGRRYEFPTMQLKIFNVSGNECEKIFSSLKVTNGKTIRFLGADLKSSREKLKDKRFNSNRYTVKFGSVIEKVIKECLVQQKIYILKKSSILANKSITIYIEDLCYRDSKIGSCFEKDLLLELNNNNLSVIGSSDINSTELTRQKGEVSNSYLLFFEKFKNIFNDTKTKKESFSRDIKVKVENIERFKYTDNRYYLYFYNTKESCNKDNDYLSKVNIKESFIEDIGTKKINSEYKWLKGRSFDKCIEGSVDSEKLKFGI